MIESTPWADVENLAVGAHVHLDELVDASPPPGSRAWLPVLHEVVEHLVKVGGNWLVTIPLGFASRLPGREAAFDAFEYADDTPLSEPPAVYRMSDKLIANTWEGEEHSWKRVVVQPCVTEIVSFHHAKADPSDEYTYLAQISYEIVGHN
jgi:hypothetical protein